MRGMPMLFSLHNPVDPVYPDAAGWKGGETSRDAAVALDGTAEGLRGAVLDVLQSWGEHTADELASFLGVDRLSIRPRLSELRVAGRVRDTGDRRPNASGHKAIVWALAERDKT